jgi:triosephosphate isomerase
LSQQIIQGLKNVENKKNIIIAYEPVWAIGSGLIPKETEIFEIVKFIKNKVKGSKVLYGGSVNSQNINLLKKIDNVDGFLVGGASQNSNNFIDIIKKPLFSPHGKYFVSPKHYFSNYTCPFGFNAKI